MPTEHTRYDVEPWGRAPRDPDVAPLPWTTLLVRIATPDADPLDWLALDPQEWPTYSDLEDPPAETVSFVDPLGRDDLEVELRWQDAEDVVSLPIRYRSGGPEDADDQARPTPADVAAVLRTRTGRAIDDDLIEGDGAFGPNTTPTLDEVESFCDRAATDVRSRVGMTVIPAGQAEQARSVAAIYAAELAELSLVPGGAADEDRSVAPQLAAIYANRVADLKAACPRWNARLV